MNKPVKTMQVIYTRGVSYKDICHVAAGDNSLQ